MVKPFKRLNQKQALVGFQAKEQSRLKPNMALSPVMA
jgi:hypothetical protein